MKPMALTGPLDQYAAESLKTTAISLLEGKADIAFDFASVDYLHTASLQVLVALWKELQGSGRTMTIVQAPARVREHFRISGTESLFHFSSSAC